MGPDAELTTHLSFNQKYYNQELVFVENGSCTESGLLVFFVILPLWNVIKRFSHLVAATQNQLINIEIRHDQKPNPLCLFASQQILMLAPTYDTPSRHYYCRIITCQIRRKKRRLINVYYVLSKPIIVYSIGYWTAAETCGRGEKFAAAAGNTNNNQRSSIK